MIDLADQIVLVTGAGGGIGAAVARALAKAGGRVVLHDAVADERLQALADDLGARAHAVSADLADPAAAERLWEEALIWMGRIDVLVNNAGVYEPARVDDDLGAWTASWERTLAINLVSRKEIFNKQSVPLGDGTPLVPMIDPQITQTSAEEQRLKIRQRTTV